MKLKVSPWVCFSPLYMYPFLATVLSLIQHHQYKYHHDLGLDLMKSKEVNTTSADCTILTRTQAVYILHILNYILKTPLGAVVMDSIKVPYFGRTYGRRCKRLSLVDS